MHNEDDKFFEERVIPITFHDEATGHTDKFTVFMRPVKVKELSILNRIAYLQEINPEDQQAASMLVTLVTDTLSMDSAEIPVEAISGLIDNFIEFNFPKPPEPKEYVPGENQRREELRKKKKAKEKAKGGDKALIECFDFLISQGHRYDEIMEYTVKQFTDFLSTAQERLGIKKRPMDTAVAFTKLGIPIKPKPEGADAKHGRPKR